MHAADYDSAINRKGNMDTCYKLDKSEETKLRGKSQTRKTTEYMIPLIENVENGPNP